MASITETVTLTTATGTVPVVVRELGVADIRRQLMADEPAAIVQVADLGLVVDALLIPDYHLADLEVFTDLTRERVVKENIPPSELARLFGRVRALNGFFFEMLPKIQAASISLANDALQGLSETLHT